MSDRPAGTRRIIIGVGDLRRRLGERSTVPIDVLLPSVEVIASVSNSERPVVGEVVIESIERGVSVLGAVDFEWSADCRRCLEPVVGDAHVSIDEIYQIDAPPDSDVLDLEGDQIDLLPLVRDAVLVGLPLAPLCREECVGPDPERFPAKTIDEVEAAAALAEPEADPRWSALDQLDFGNES